METTKNNGNGGAPAAETSTALALRGELAPSPYEPTNLNDARALAKEYTDAKLAKGVRSAAQALMIMATGRELGIPATTALRMIYVADFGQGDQITLSADLMVALCLRSPLCEYFEAVEATDERATCAAKRKGRPERRVTFTIQDAQRAKLGQVKPGNDASATNWAKYPSVMLRHRAASLLAREVFPDVIGGFYTEDEAREIAERTIEGRLVASEVRPLTAAAPSTSAATGGAATSTATSTATAPAESIEARAARWEAALRAATSEDEGKAVTREIVAALPDKADPTRKALAALFSERKKAGWTSPTATSAPAPAAEQPAPAERVYRSVDMETLKETTGDGFPVNPDAEDPE